MSFPIHWRWNLSRQNRSSRRFKCQGMISVKMPTSFSHFLLIVQEQLN
jgi:hypothetical protein